VSDTESWVTGRAPGTSKPVLLVHRSFLLEQVEEEHQRGPANQG